MNQEPEELPSIESMTIGAPESTPATMGAFADTPEEKGPESPILSSDPAGGVCRAAPVDANRQSAPMPAPTPTSRPHPRTSASRPASPDDEALFRERWWDRSLTLEVMGRIYGCNPRTIQKWAQTLRLGPRADGPASGEPPNPSVPLSPQPPKPTPAAADARFDPLANPDIRAALDEIGREGVTMTDHSDLTKLQRMLYRLSVLVTAKAPAYSWSGLRETVEDLSHATLYARKVEAKLPAGPVDQVALRKEAASQMMREMKSVLTEAEQAELGRILWIGADRLIKGQGRPVTT